LNIEVGSVSRSEITWILLDPKPDLDPNEHENQDFDPHPYPDPNKVGSDPQHWCKI